MSSVKRSHMKKIARKPAPKKKTAAKKAAAKKSARRTVFSKSFDTVRYFRGIAAMATRDERETERFLSAR